MKIKERRIWAFLIDVGFVSCISGLVQVIIPTIIQTFGLEISSVQIVISVSLSALFYLGYFMAFDVWNEGISIGKSALALQVRSPEGSLPSLDQRLIRTMLKTTGIIFFPVSAALFIYNSFTLQDHFMQSQTTQEVF